MDRCFPLQQSSPEAFAQVELPPVEWMKFTMPESHFLGQNGYHNQPTWCYTWKAILLASGIPHNGSTNPAEFLLSKQDDHALAVLVRTTITPKELVQWEFVDCVAGQQIFTCLCGEEGDEAAIEIVYPSQLTKEKAAEFSVRDKPLEIIEYNAKMGTEV